MLDWYSVTSPRLMASGNPIDASFCRAFRTRNEDDMLDARPHGRVDGSDVLRPALSGIEARDDEQTIETRKGLGKAFGPVVVPESCLSRSRDGLGRARDSHYLVPVGTLQ